jgi:hypothetical protein
MYGIDLGAKTLKGSLCPTGGAKAHQAEKAERKPSDTLGHRPVRRLVVESAKCVRGGRVKPLLRFPPENPRRVNPKGGAGIRQVKTLPGC